ncbi:MAG: hypothetical protein Q4G71_03920 [Pseudomonadota bacterium]|nr:hypothetical protein [Pseudomonadota bacterium]
MVNWVVPAVVAAAVIAATAKFAGAASLLGDSGVIARVLGFVQSLAGFYVAALAAVATFPSVGMDQLMPGTPPTMTIVYNGTTTRVQLTRRRFLCSMFAFLTAVSLLITLIALTALALGPTIASTLVEPARTAVRVVFGGAFIFVLLQMISVTFWGLFYLGERMHTPD